MKQVFVDTSYYIALFSPSDCHHAKAIELARSLKHRSVVTEFVLLEFGNVSSSGKARDVFLDLLRRLRNDPNTILVPAARELFDRGCELFARRPDKEWSLTDCTSFIVMDQYGLTDVFTSDHHFEQAGFNVLLK